MIWYRLYDNENCYQLITTTSISIRLLMYQACSLFWWSVSKSFLPILLQHNVIIKPLMPLSIFTVKFVIITVLLINLYYYCPNSIINNIFIIVLSLQCSKCLSVILIREIFKTQWYICDEAFWENSGFWSFTLSQKPP